MFGELEEGAGCVGGAGKRVDWVCLSDDLRAFGINADQWTTAAQDEGISKWCRIGGTRGGTFHGEMDRCRESQGWTTRHAVVYPNATGKAK